MRTDHVKKKLTAILYKIIGEAETTPNIDLKYCDIFTAKSSLDLEVSVKMFLYDNRLNEPNKQHLSGCDWVQVNKFDVLNESGKEMLSEGQRKELVKYIDDFVYKHYSNL